MRTIWKVYPEDPDMTHKVFETKQSAQEWADSLCYSYTIEEVVLW